MPLEINMPQLGLTMEKGTLVRWLVAVDDLVEPGQPICEVETDKAVVTVEAHHGGQVARLLASPHQEVPVGAPIALLLAPGETLPANWQPAASVPEPALPLGAPTPSPAPTGPRQVSWKARTLARQAGLDLSTVSGSGPEGRITAADIARALEARSIAPAAAEPAPAMPAKASPLAAKLAAALGLDLARVAGSGSQGRIMEEDVLNAAASIIKAAGTPAPRREKGPAQVAERIPLAGVRRIVSERMATSAHTAARVTIFREVDATALIALRERFKAQGHQISYNDILARLCVVALREHPAANARLGDGCIERLDRVNLGLAVDTERGLLVPVIHSADTLTILEIAAESARLIAAARAGRSAPDDLTGGTFTISNLGMLGVEGFTPVINLPEACILGIGRIVRKPVVCDERDTVTVRPMMVLSLAFDHRVIDGAPAARFLGRIVQFVEDPTLLLTLL